MNSNYNSEMYYIPNFIRSLYAASMWQPFYNASMTECVLQKDVLLKCSMDRVFIVYYDWIIVFFELVLRINVCQRQNS